MIRKKISLVTTPIIYLSFWVFLGFVLLNSAIQGFNDGRFITFLVSSIFFLIVVVIILGYYIGSVETYQHITKNHFLDTYFFPEELSKILIKKYPHLNRSEVAEVLDAIKEFYRFHINKDLSIPQFMPSHVVDFACQTFFEMPSSSSFFRNFSHSGKRYHRAIPKSTSTDSKEFITVLLAGQYEEQTNSVISEMWCYCCDKKGIDPFFPSSFPSFFTLDKRLKIPSGFVYELDETQFRETHSMKWAPNPLSFNYSVQRVKDINFLAKKLQFYLGSYDYCHQYQRNELEGLFGAIDKNQLLAQAVYGQYSDVDLFKKTVLNNSVPTPSSSSHREVGGCGSSGASI